MREHAVGADVMALDDVAAQRDHGIDLGVRKIGIAEAVAAVADLDADRARIDVGLVFPARDAGVPGPARLWHELPDLAALVDDVMARHLGDRITQARQRCRRVRGAGVVEQQNVGGELRRPRPVVGRGP
jgi:hypothetical protein